MHYPQNDYWERAQEHLKQRQLPAADEQLQLLRSLDPHGVRTQLLGAQIHWHAGRMHEAADQALVAAQIACDNPSILVDVITTLRLVGETARAHAVFARADWQGMTVSPVLYRLAIVCQGFGEYGRALSAFDRLAGSEPDNATWDFFRGQQLEFLGRFEAAAFAYERCLLKSPGFGYAAYKLARLRPQTERDNLLPLIDLGLAFAPPDSSGQADFEFARYHVLEELGRSDAAWQALDAANAAMHALGLADAGFDAAGLQDFCSRMADVSIPAGRDMPAGPYPIFIVGMPRAGTTVLERMLGNHSQVQGVGELTDFGMQLMRVADNRDVFGAASIARVPSLDYAAVGRGYLAQTAWRVGGKAYFVDKQPTNWMLVALIRAALPQTKILHLVRDPMDTCFSIWRARFADAHAWSYRIDALAEHFSAYRGLMRHWKQAYPDAMLEVDYAELVQQPAATLRGVMDFCGLEWEPGCEDPSRNPAPVSTLSSTQAREPVNTRGLGHWRRYAAQLEPLRRALSGA